MKTKLTVNKDFPYIGLESYSESYKDFFYGREDEVKELSKKINNNILTILFGKSGLGKTSLLQAGLVPELRKNYYLPITIRINFDTTLTPLHQVKKILDSQIKKVDDNALLIGDLTLWEYFHRLKVLNGFVKPILIFDQFEELFSKGKEKPKEINELINEITCLVENQIPEIISEKYEKEKPIFDVSQQNYRVLLSLREDFLPELENYNSIIPSLKKNRFRLMQLSRDNAIEAIAKPGEKILDHDDAVKIVDLIFSKTIPDYAKQRENEDVWENYFIEPFLLNLVCYQINNTRIQEYANKIDDTLLEKIDINRIIKNFYYQNTYDLSAEAKNIIENGLLTHDGYRKLQHKSDLLLRSGISENDINKLIDRRIIRNEIWNGGEHLELIHDILVPIIKESRDKRLEEEKRRKREAELLEIRRQEEQKRIEEKKRLEEEALQERIKQKQKLRFTRIIAGIISIAAVVAIVLAMYAYNQKQEAQQKQKESFSNLISANALLEAEKDPTLAFRLAEYAYNASPGMRMSEIALRLAFYKDNFYSVLVKNNLPVNTFDISPNGEYFIYASEDSIMLIDKKGEKIKTFKQVKGTINSVKFSPNGKYIATAGSAKKIYILGIDGKLLLEIVGHTETINDLVFSNDSKKIISISNDNSVKMWTIDGSESNTLDKHTNDVVAIDVANNNRLLVTGGADRKIILWGIDGKYIRHFEDKAAISAIKFSEDAKFIYTGSRDSVLRKWDLDGKLIREFKGHNGYINTIALSHAGKYIVTAGNDKKVFVWNNNDGKIVKNLLGHQGTIKKVIVSPDNKYIYTASLDKTIRSWRISSMQNNILFKLSNPAYSFDFSPENNAVLLAVKNNALLLDIEGNVLQKFEGHGGNVISARFSSDGKNIITASFDGTAILWNLRGEKVQTFDGNTDKLYYAELSTDNQKVITCSGDGVVIIWSVKGKVLKRISDAHVGMVAYAKISPDQKYFATAGMDGVLKLWNMQTGIVKTNYEMGNDMISYFDFSPDSKKIVTLMWDSEIAHLWDLNANKLTTFIGHEDALSSVHFSSNGQYIITASNDNTVIIWSTRGNKIFHYKRHSNDVLEARFINQSEYVASLSIDKTLRMWPFASKEIIKLINENKIYGEVEVFDQNLVKKYQ